MSDKELDPPKAEEPKPTTSEGTSDRAAPQDDASAGNTTIVGDQVGSDKVGGDKIGGDAIRADVGADAQNVAIGKDITLITKNYYGVLPATSEEGDAAAEPAPGEAPYQGLHVFDVDDAYRFFGRESLTAQLVAALRDQRFLAVIGASGSGKSSVVRAGVLPALTKGEALADGTLPPKGSTDWLVHVIKPTAQPLKALSASLTKGSESMTAQTTLMDDLEEDVRSLDLFASRLLADSPSEHLLLVVDQFEELFTLCKASAERKAFVDNLLTAAQPNGTTTVVITLRADFYHRCAEFDDLRSALAAHQEYIGAMTRDDLRAAIEKPAEQGGWDFETGLVDVMLDEVEDEPGALPLLSHALLETWMRRRGRTLTFAGYHDAGGVKGGIARRADSEFNELSPEEQTVARNVFVRLTELGEGSEDTRRRVARDELLGTGSDLETVTKVLTTLGTARLITADEDAVEVAHEALIREWPLLRRWLEDDREGLRLHRRLTDEARNWDASGRNPGDLYSGTRLEQTIAWATTNRDVMNDLERTYLDASQEQIEAERRELERLAHEREEARQRELEQAQALAAVEEQRATEAEARRQAEAEARAQAEARQMADAQRAEEAEMSARRSRRRSWYLGAALAVALVATGATFYFFQQAATNAEVAQRNSVVAEARLAQFGSAVGGLGAERVLELADELDRSGDSAGAVELLRAAVDQTEGLFSNMPLDGLDPDQLRLLSLAGSVSDENGASYVYIPAGEFTMGSLATRDNTADTDEMPQHAVYLDAYFIMQTEVTNVQYGRCVEANVCYPSRNSRWNEVGYELHPVTNVFWFDAATYAEWVGGRLPTEVEWEKACRGTDVRTYPWGAASPTDSLLNYSENIGSTTEVGGYPAGANGLYDMAGNAWEWTSSQYQDYPYDAQDGREDQDGAAARSLRGGSWDDLGSSVRCANRFRAGPGYDHVNVGFRVVSPGF